MVLFIERWIGIFWLAIIILLSLAAFTSKRSVQRQSGGSRFLQAGLVVIGAILIFNLGHAFARGWLTDRVIPLQPSWVLTGAVLTLLGILFAVWARITLGRNWSGVVAIKQDHELILRGPYRLVRHPIYTGFLLGLLGTALVYGATRCFVGLLLCGLVFWLKLRIEEQFMMQQFGEQYAHYRQRVRALVPFVL
ncbi:MAG: isoprenylcysteine carboxylmethyltransferase family protein [Acidobacteriaceae bacterium]